MKTKIYILLVTLALALPGYSQRCASDEFYKDAVKNNPDIVKAEKEFNKFADTYGKYNYGARSGRRIIPVVFHVFHVDGAENISEAQIKDQIRVLNDDYNRLNPDTVNLRDSFKSRATGLDIEFRLATKDPNGNCTNGITRTYSTYTSNADDAIKYLNTWNTAHYLNIWVVKAIKDRTPGQTVLGYAQFPWQGSYYTDGVLIRADQIGTIGTAATSPNMGRVATHEIGHWLGLMHPFQDGCQGSDMVDDTPPVKDPNFGCTYRNSCTNDVPDMSDMIENYMDYADGVCENTFTKGQKIRVDAVLENFRQFLNKDFNLKATGTDQPNLSPACPPTADFFAVTTTVCENGTLDFQDNSYNGKATSWEWTFEGGTPAASTQKNVTVTYKNPGSYDITLKATNAIGSAETTKKKFVVIASNTAWSANLVKEDFEGAFPAPEWSLMSTTKTQWAKLNGYSTSGSYCMYVPNGTFAEKDEYNLISPTVDLSANSNPSYSFNYSYTPRTTANGPTQDRLSLYYSLNCGKTWTRVWSAVGPNLNSLVGVPYDENLEFFPKSKDMWLKKSVSLPTLKGKSNVKFRLEFISDGGNNMFVDDINMGWALAAQSAETESRSFNIYPNPSDAKATVSVETTQDQQVKIYITDLQGRQVSVLVNQKLAAGQHQFVTGGNLAPGTYMVIGVVDNQVFTRKYIQMAGN